MISVSRENNKYKKTLQKTTVKTLRSVNNITAINLINLKERLRLLQKLFNRTKIFELDNSDKLTKTINTTLPNFSAALDNQAQTKITESITNQY